MCLSTGYSPDNEISSHIIIYSPLDSFYDKTSERGNSEKWLYPFRQDEKPRRFSQIFKP